MSDRGVPPIVGVILMVAITVILAYIIAQFVLGLSASSGGGDYITKEDGQVACEQFLGENATYMGQGRESEYGLLVHICQAGNGTLHTLPEHYFQDGGGSA